MAVAPLLLLPFAGSDATATVILWLAAFGFIWVMMEPSRRRGEMPHDARTRLAQAVIHDPVFWLSVVLVAYAAVRAANGGIGIAYDAELLNWSFQKPSMTLMPGCVDGTGYFPFAMMLSLAVIFQGVRHALGRSARSAFLLVSSLVSGCAAVVYAFAVSYGNRQVLAFTDGSILDASYFGTAFGIQSLCALVALFDAVEGKWIRAEPVATAALVANAIGLVLLAPPLTLAAFAGAFLLMTILSFALARGRLEGSGSFRCALAVLMTIGAAVMYAIGTSDSPLMAAKIKTLRTFMLFSDDFFKVRAALSAIALKTWKANPWLGTGLGSFPIDLRFSAVAADWVIVSPAQKTALNGWWQLLTERGVVGAGLMAVTVGMLVWTYVSRLVRSFRSIQFSAEHFIGLVAVAAVSALAFFDCSFLRPEVLLLSGTLLAFSAGALPSHARKDDEGKERN